ncbi:hypothetical protein F8388_015924 [Cannabis sativa]|uniref:laccase n=1 Tax=Cannabis sativa TaxID=3483 RepID=A0A7J6EEP2_CANSA|nr:hypothetical protein F8388_015924 [Cannabis sativa]KAF4401584.1 hypothetical protein G4B88_001778 [Cannabis sativa]
MAKSISGVVVAWSLLATLLASSMASATIVHHSLYIKNLTVNYLCEEQVVIAANGSLPGPTIRVHEGDTLVIKVVNLSPHNISIHWHGIFQLQSGWADGPEYVTQCPIGSGEWWNGNVVDIEKEALLSGGAPNISDAFTINGKPGDFYPCSKKDTYKLKVVKGKTYMLRIINAALNNQLFFKIANHKMTVVAVDASYTNPYITDVVVSGPGQTIDILFTANQDVGSYYMTAHPYITVAGAPFDNTTTRGIIVYEGSTSSTPIMPVLPAFNDTPTAHTFFTNLTGLAGGPQWVPVPLHVDKHMFITIGLSLDFCKSGNATCPGPFGQSFSASMNNQSFVLPKTISILEAYFSGVSGIYTTNFPKRPPTKFDYTNTSLSIDQSLLFAQKGTKVTKLKFNEVVEIVFQNTALIGVENHPIHLHGFNFHILAQGFGNFKSRRDSKKFNLVNPQIRNTIGVPVGGWAVIRFQANNPGIWLMHCHLDVHLPWGLATAFEVENGDTPSSKLPPPPKDLPKCF